MHLHDTVEAQPPLHTNYPEYRGAIEIDTGITAQTPPRPDMLLVIEKWESDAALAAHLDAPHVGAFAARTAGMMTERVIRVARDISGPHDAA